MRTTSERGRNATQEAASNPTAAREQETRLACIARLAACLLDAPMAGVWTYESGAPKLAESYGLDGGPPEFWDADKSSTVLLIANAAADPRFASHPAVLGAPHVRFFVSAPLRFGAGERLGTLCVMDTRPRELEPRLQSLFADLSKLIGDDLGAERSLHRAQTADSELKRLVRIIEEAPDFIGSTDPAGRFTFINPAGRRMLGIAPDGDLGHLHISAAHTPAAAGEIADRAVPQALEKGTWIGETALTGADGREVPVSEVIVAHRDEMGRLAHLSLLARDITDRRKALAALRESEARFRGTFENAAVGMAHIGLDGSWLRVNQRLLDIVGYEREELLARTFQDITHPDDLPRDMELRRRLFDGVIDQYVIEKRYSRKDGRIVWVHKTVARQPTDPGTQPYMIAVIVDITERKEAEEQQRLLLAELNHRVKNTLATIQAIATQTLRRTTNPHEFVERFLGRLQSVSGVHNLLTEKTWEGAELEALVLDQVHLSGMVEPERLSAAGPAMILPPQIALNLAMVLHELAANAMKHGALSQPSGTLDVRWALEPGPQHPVVRLVWTERGGPPPQRSPRKGFGTLLLERGIVQGLGGEANLDWRETGLVATLAVPIPAYAKRKGYFRP